MKEHTEQVAILIVNGGQDPDQGKWLSLCVNKIIQHTRPGSYRLYIWNNNIRDRFIADFLQFIPNCQLIQAPPGIVLTHIHADPLQRLYEIAIADGAQWIVTMDSDAHPVRDGWLDTLIAQLKDGAVLAGIWRDELRAAIQPYLHASCLATSVGYIEDNQLRLDDIPENQDGVIHDTLSQFTRCAQKSSDRIFTWNRSNRRQFHRLIGGVYGDFIYHHGAGSRATVSFWDEPLDRALMKRNARIAQISTHFLFSDYANYIDWLRGGDTRLQSRARLDHLRAGRLEMFDDIPAALPRRRSLYQDSVGRIGQAVKSMRKRSSRRLRAALTGSRKNNPWSLMVRPFTRHDFKHYQTDKRSEAKGPDFIGIGVPKAGTSWWYSLVLEHPTVVANQLFNPSNAQATKELDFFTHFVDRELTEEDRQTYCSAFARPNGKICGEWTTTYLANPLNIQHLAKTAPRAKIIVLLRNPVDRFLSHVDHLVRNRGRALFKLDDQRLALFKTHSAIPEAYLHSCYAPPLKALLGLYDRDNILLLQYERCRNNPMAQLIRTYQFLGIDDTFVPQQINRKINEQSRIFMPASNAVRQPLVELFSQDVAKCLEMFPEDIDLTYWHDFLQ